MEERNDFNHLGADSPSEKTAPTRVHQLRDDGTDIKHGDSVRSKVFKDGLTKREKYHTIGQSI